MESNSEFAPNVHSTPVCTGTLDLQKIVDELKREFNVMKAERGRERVEMDALRQEVAELKSRVSALEAAREREAEEGGERGAVTAREGLAEEARVEGSLPDRPFTDLDDFLQFERSLESDAALQNVIRTLGTRITAQSTKEWVNTSWQLVLSDEVGSRCTWTGIRGKECVRDLRITLAMRRAFERKFGNEEEFEEKTKAFFRSAQDRAKKKAQYAARQNQDRPNE
ncbi:hypothetical protein ACLKA6_003005 [Drosophila palustris]